MKEGRHDGGPRRSPSLHQHCPDRVDLLIPGLIPVVESVRDWPTILLQTLRAHAELFRAQVVPRPLILTRVQTQMSLPPSVPSGWSGSRVQSRRRRGPPCIDPVLFEGVRQPHRVRPWRPEAFAARGPEVHVGPERARAIRVEVHLQPLALNEGRTSRYGSAQKRFEKRRPNGSPG